MYPLHSDDEHVSPRHRKQQASQDAHNFEDGYPPALDDDCESADDAEVAYGQDDAEAEGFPLGCENASSPLPGEALPPLPGEPDPPAPLRLMCAGPCFTVGGVEQHTLSLAKFLDPRRVRLTGCLVLNAAKPQRAPAATAPFPIRPCAPGELSEAVRDCDVLLIWGEAFNNLLGKTRPLCVYLAHGESWWTRKGLVSSSQVTDHVIAVSMRVQHRVCAGFPTTTIWNGVDSSRLGQSRSIAAIREQLGFAPHDFVLGTVGRFTREKRTELLIEAAALLPRSFKLLLVGYGPRRAELLDLANERIPGRYAIVKASDYLGDYYGAMDSFCLPSAHEGFGLVISEAMLCERPVIATNVGCVPEIICNRISGLVVEHSAQAFAQAATHLRMHPDWARGRALEGQAFAARHLHAERMARDYENLLLRLYRGRAAGKREAAR